MLSVKYIVNVYAPNFEAWLEIDCFNIKIKNKKRLSKEKTFLKTPEECLLPEAKTVLLI